MRCLSCNAILTDKESIKKDGAGNYLDMCSKCFFNEEFLDEPADDRNLEDYFTEIKHIEQSRGKVS